MKKMIFTQEAYDEIMETVARLPAETGGILLGNRDDFIVQKFIFDNFGSRGPASYDPDIGSLNKIIKKEWEENELALIGFIHSHPRGYAQLSGDWGNGVGDIGYIKKIFSYIEALEQFLVPIVYSTDDGGEYKMFPFMAERGDEDNYQTLPLEIIPKYKKVKPSHNDGVSSIENKEETDSKKKEESTKERSSSKENTKGIDVSRINGSVYPSLLENSHVVCIGIGGASGICEDLVRTGLGRLTAIDFDTVDESNLTTQGFYRNDIGKLKVEALGDRVKNINPDCNYRAMSKDFLKMSEGEIADIIKDADLILFMTDDFYTQKRGNLVSLKYKTPAIFAIMYEKARCAEITFNMPGITPACHRCATSSRYSNYEQGYKNVITSESSTVFQTHYFNSAIGMIALAILHNDIKDVEFGNWFGSKWERNLVQLRLNNNYSSLFENNISLFEKTFSSADASRRTFTFDSIWQTIEEEKPPKYKFCPDCGGIGDLSKVLINQSV